jgi:drug/metabolite transporter (DMT)-like permease
MQEKKVSRAMLYRLAALLVMLLWGSLYPGVKLGYRYLEINTASVPDIMMFAGNRFLVCGTIITLLTLGRGDRLNTNIKASVWPVISMGLTGVVLHYVLNYTSLTMTESGRAAILKSVGPLMYICLSFLFMRDEKFSVKKLIGATLGFAGIAAMNADAQGGLSIRLGDILMIGASLAGILSNISGKKAMACNSPFVVTGVSQLFGGVVLTLMALMLGAQTMKLSPAGLLVFAYICFASIVAYLIWYRIMKLIPLSATAFIRLAEPFSSTF